MFSLILKDLLLSKKTILFASLYAFFIMIGFRQTPISGFSAGLMTVSYLLVSSNLAWDEKNKSEILLNSLPIKRTTIVLAKYLSSALFILLSFTVFLIVLLFFKLSDQPIPPLNPSLFLGILAAQILIFSVYLPVYFKLGYIRSKMVNMLIIIAMFAVSALFAEFIRLEYPPALKAVVTFSQTLSQIGIMTFLALTLFLVTMLSIRLSIVFYRKKEF